MQVFLGELHTSKQLLAQVAPGLFRVLYGHLLLLELCDESLEFLVILWVVADYYMLLVEPGLDHLVELDGHLGLGVVLHADVDWAALCTQHALIVVLLQAIEAKRVDAPKVKKLDVQLPLLFSA